MILLMIVLGGKVWHSLKNWFVKCFKDNLISVMVFAVIVVGGSLLVHNGLSSVQFTNNDIIYYYDTQNRVSS